MDKTLIKKMSIVIVPILIVVGLLVYFVGSLRSNPTPIDFSAARQRASVISQDIVNLTTDTGKKINEANQAEANGDINRILSLISDAKNSNSSAYQKAFDMSQLLQQMAESLNSVQSNKQEIGYQAIATELSLVSEFIAYTKNLNDFLNILAQSALDETPNSQKAINDALQKVNQKTTLINGLNRDFVDKMAAFDQIN